MLCPTFIDGFGPLSDSCNAAKIRLHTQLVGVGSIDLWYEFVISAEKETSRCA
jgi:hypothetical protein